jgi:uncharacterized membrane protein
MDVFVFGAAVFIAVLVAVVAAIPMLPNRTTRRLWILGVVGAALGLAALYALLQRARDI